MKCWGDNTDGQLGLGDTDARGDEPGEMGDRLPVVPLGTARRATNIALGSSHACAVLDDGSLKCWGANSAGQLGLGDLEYRGDQPDEMGDRLATVDLGAGLHATSIAAGSSHTCALLDDGSVKCWGGNFDGQLGLGDTDARGDQPGEMGENLQPVQLGSGRRAVSITAGSSHSCALLDDASVKCWGFNEYGQLGQGDVRKRGVRAGELGDNLPGIALGSGRHATSISAQLTTSCALLDDASVKCWGDSSFGALGLGTTVNRGDQAGEMGDSLPPIDLGVGKRAASVSVGGVHVCALLEDGAIKCWGRNNGELGLGDIDDRGDQPNEMGDNLADINLGTRRTARQIAAGYAHNCALLTDASVKCWGRDPFGLGLGEWQPRGDGPGQMGDALPAVDIGF